MLEKTRHTFSETEDKANDVKTSHRSFFFLYVSSLYHKRRQSLADLFQFYPTQPNSKQLLDSAQFNSYEFLMNPFPSYPEYYRSPSIHVKLPRIAS